MLESNKLVEQLVFIKLLILGNDFLVIAVPMMMIIWEAMCEGNGEGEIEGMIVEGEPVPKEEEGY